MAAQTAAATVAFHIAPGPLASALTAYAQQSGLQLLFDHSLTAGQTSPGLTGRVSPEEALDKLLAGRRFRILRRPGVIVLRADDPPADDTPVARSDPGSAPPFGANPPSTEQGASQGSTAAAASASAEAAPMVNEVVVTGTLIRGSTEVASPVITLSREAIDRAGQATVAEALAALPQAFSGASTPQTELLGSDGLGTNLAVSSGVNLRGLGANSTLVLVDGRRMAGSGLNGDFADVSAIPIAAVDHIEVLLDGASALYGSDAVGGVINVILRQDFTGAETRLRYGAARGGDHGDLQAAQTFGQSWSGGHLVFSYEYDHTDALAGADRAATADADLRPLGGADHRLPYSHPGNILDFDPASSSYVPTYAIPSNQNGSGLTPSSFLAAMPNLENYRALADVLPEQQRHSAYLNIKQSFSPRIDGELDARFTRRSFDFDLPENLSVLQVTPADPYFVSPDGSQSELIGYGFGDELGPIRNGGYDSNFGVTASAGVALGRTWRIELSADLAQEESLLASRNIVNGGYLDEALGNVPDDPTTSYSAARDGYFNPYGDGGANSAALLGFIGSGVSDTSAISRETSVDLKADGEVLQLPGGALKIAVGGQVRTDSFHSSTYALTYGSSPYEAGTPVYSRTIAAAFAELRVPLVGAGNALPGVRSLELSLAGRVEHYSDVGLTGNPQLGLAWRPLADLKFRASYGTSFRAPALPEIDAVQQIAPSFAARGDDQVLTLVRYGGNSDLKPETATTWTVGFDYRPIWAPGLTVAATWFDISYENRIGQPVLEDFSHALTDPSYAPFVTLVDPSRSPADLARVQALLANPADTDPSTFPANAYGAIIDARYVNAASLHVRGLDVTAAYTLRLASDRFDLALNSSYTPDYLRRLTPTSPSANLVGEPGQPSDLRLRASASWTRGPYSATLGANFTDGSRSLDGRAVDSWTTVDLQLAWTSPASRGPLHGVTLALNAQNLLDADPPFYDSPQAVGYDPANADPLGRVLSVQLVKRW